jgi:hypothetical protein
MAMVLLAHPRPAMLTINATTNTTLGTNRMNCPDSLRAVAHMASNTALTVSTIHAMASSPP